MVTTTLRAVILVAAVALGIAVVRSGFPAGPQPSPAGGSPPAATAAPTTTTPGAPTTTASPRPRPTIEGTVVQVLNGTDQAGLAAQVSETLKEAGFTVATPGNAADAPRTTIYFQEGYRDEAQLVNRRFFRRIALVAPAPQGFDPDLNLVIVLGADFVSP
ncbi:MAG TPA: LytR C-terminal domain-containing protein [Actinomycetota bacterium]|nr:LytR C-terminal domain-containing protein [Actinomycetota bacterium]